MDMTSVEAARMIALVVPASVIAMWAMMYRGMKAQQDVRCADRARRELAEAQHQPAGTLAKVGAQRTARKDADVAG